MTKARKTPLSERELWRSHELCEALGISRTQLYVLHKDEQIPAPIHIGGSPTMYWRAAEIRDWHRAGAPERSRWVWKPTLPQKLDDLLADLHRQIRKAEARLARVQAEVEQNEQLLLEADQ